MNRVEAMFKAIQDVDMGRYSMKTEEVTALYRRYATDPFRLIFNSFRYGFVKGRRAEKAAARVK